MEHKFSYLEEQYEKLTQLGNHKEHGFPVFLARRKSTGQIVVLKYISREAYPIYRQLKALCHPGLVTIIDCAVSTNTGLVIEEYVSGKLLSEILEENGSLEEARAAGIIRELLHVLQIIHAENIVHRDITPNNILISTDGVLKLLDFGIARRVKSECRQDTVILGTAGFAAPEQFGFHQTDARTDIYAVGILWNKLLTGKFPNEQLCASQPARQIILKCTEMDAANRYQTAADLLSECKPAGQNPPDDAKKDWKKRIPGFRTGKVWKSVIATLAYCIMLLYTGIGIIEYGQTPAAFLLEAAAIFLYIWLAPLLLMNFLDWDRRLSPFCFLPKISAAALRIVLWFVLFYAGISIEEYVKSILLDLPAS